MKHIKKKLSWFLVNVGLIATFFCGMIYSKEGLINVACALIWITTILSYIVFILSAFSESLLDTLKASRQVPLQFSRASTLILAIGMFYFGWLWLGSFYLVGNLLVISLMASKKEEKNNNDS